VDLTPFCLRIRGCYLTQCIHLLVLESKLLHNIVNVSGTSNRNIDFTVWWGVDFLKLTNEYIVSDKIVLPSSMRVSARLIPSVGSTLPANNGWPALTNTACTFVLLRALEKQLDQIAFFFTPSIFPWALRNLATCGANQGN